MIALLAATATPVVVFISLAGLFLGAWGLNKYKDVQAKRRSQDLRDLYASVQSERPRR
jgi:hypothetical protein